MSMYSVKGLKREYTQTSGFSYEVSEDTSNIGGTCLQAKFSEIGIKPMTFKQLVSIIGAPTDIMFGDEKSELSKIMTSNWAHLSLLPSSVIVWLR